MTPNDYEFLKQFLKNRSGLVLSNDKQYLIESRLLPVARTVGLTSISDLVAKLKGAPSADLVRQVTEAMTTNESFFFRDKTPFDHFEKVMLPHMLEKRAAQKRMRIWCAAASTGQEPYSLAMLLKEKGAMLAGWRIEIIGTDLSTQALEKAKAGVYSQFEVQRGLPIQLLLKYFSQNGEAWQVAPEIRAAVTYRPHNLLESLVSLGTFDIVFCRNVLIYFDKDTKTDVLERIAAQMSDEGFLVLGAAETVIGLSDAFKPVQGKRGLYQVEKRQPRRGAAPLRVAAAGR